MTRKLNQNEFYNVIHGISWLAIFKDISYTVDENDEEGNVIKSKKVKGYLPILQYDILGIILNFLEADIPAYFYAKLVQLNVESLLKFRN
jgi:hypothetical protein